MIKIWSVFCIALALGLLAPTGVVSTFPETYDYIVSGNGECTICHSGIMSQLTVSNSHANTAWSQKQVFDCVECHTVSDIGENPGGVHDAQNVDCAYCHSKAWHKRYGLSEYENRMHALKDKYGMPCDSCHTPPGQSTSNVFIDDVFDEITWPEAAHYDFYVDAEHDGALPGGSESCVGCHTHILVKFTQLPGGNDMIYDPSTGQFEIGR